MPSNRAAVQATPNIKPEQTVVLAQSDITIPITGDISSTKVFNTLIDTSTWPKWNRFVPKCIIHSQPTSTTTISSNHPPSSSNNEGDLSPVLQLGTRFTMYVNMGLKPETTLEDSLRLYEEGKLTVIGFTINLFEEPNPAEGKPGKIVWTGDPSSKGAIPYWLLRAERMHIISEEDGTGGKVVKVNNWEFQAGWLAWIVKWLYQSMLENTAFPAWVKGLKEYVTNN